MPGEAASAGHAPRRIRIWDAPIRIVHWAVALLVPWSWWTAHHDMMGRHLWSGYAVLGLLVFRLIWGFAGSGTARFAGFVRGPATVWNYARNLVAREEPPAAVGHNPLGGWAVVAMLAALAGQVCLGLFSTDEDGLESGPLANFVSYDTARAAAGVHHIMFYVILGLIALHLAAILVHHLFFRHNLVGPMITGRGEGTEGIADPAYVPAWRFAAAAGASVALMWFVSKGLRF